MKKIYFLATLVLATLFTACEDFNEKNFPGYDEAAKPTNLTNYNYTITAQDFVTIGDAVKKGVETQISKENTKLTAIKNELKKATNATDSAAINDRYDALKIEVDANIASLKLDPNYIAGMYLKAHKHFNSSYPAADYAPYLLNTKYQYSDYGSTVQLTYKHVEDADTVTITASNKYTMTPDDYNALGEGLNQPGQFDNFSAVIDPDIFIPRLLEVKYPLAQKGDVKLIKYLFYESSITKLTYSLFLNDGTKWIANSKTEQFLFANSKEWVFDPTITIEPNKDDFLLLLQYLYNNDDKPHTKMVGRNDWKEDDLLRFIINPAFPPASPTDFGNVRTEFFFGTSWYHLNIDVRISSRTYANDIELKAAFKSIDENESLNSDAKAVAKSTFLDKRVKQGLAIMLELKYPEMPTQVKGLDQYVKVNVQTYDGARWYWTYKYKCIETGTFNFVERTKWK